MTIEGKFKHLFKDLIQDLPLEEINVSLLCKKAGCHRQTFYYHFQDIYDLVAAIFLNEDIPQFQHASDIDEVLNGFGVYCCSNFKFIKSIYNSSAKDLCEDFAFSKIMTRCFEVLQLKNQLSSNVARIGARRFSRFVTDEISYIFKNNQLTVDMFKKEFKVFAFNSVKIVLPSMIEMAKQEG